MRYFIILFVLIGLILANAVAAQAQTPGSAVNNFQEGLKKTERGDLDGAIEDFTRAIEISSRLDRAKNVKGPYFTSSYDGEAAAVTVVDPFTAKAYVNRGVARFRKGDLEGAIEDYDRAVRIITR